MEWTIIFLTTLFAGTVQGITGFGAAIVIMCVLPYAMSLFESQALANIVSMVINISLLVHYRKEVQWKQLIFPALFYFIGSTLSVNIAIGMDRVLLRRCFGVFLILLAAYFIFFGKKIHLKENVPTLIACGLLAGFFEGAFGAGSGPVFVLYFMTVCPTRGSYIGTVQGCLLTGYIYLLFLRISKGIITEKSLLPAAVGVAGVVVGLLLAHAIGKRINDEALRKVVYGMITVSGLATILTA